MTQPDTADQSHYRYIQETILQNSLAECLVTVRDIIITGNKKTKESIILREIPFKSGEAYPLSRTW